MPYVVRALAALSLLLGTAAFHPDTEAPHGGLAGCLELDETRFCYATAHTPRVLAPSPACDVSAQITDAAGVPLGALAEASLPESWRVAGAHAPLTGRMAARLRGALADVA